MATDLGSLFVRIGSETSGLKQGEREVDRSTRKMEQNIRRTEGAAKKLWLAIGGTAAIYAGVRMGKAVVEASIAMERIDNSLRAATGSAQLAQREFAFVRGEAERLGLNLLSSADAYSQLTAATRGTELAGQATRDIFIGVSEAATVLGLSAYETEGALRAIEQMVSKGNVQAEELRGQLGERLPGAFQIAARAMGVTTQELNKMLDEGQVLASDLLPKLAAELRKTFSKDIENAVNGTQQAINRFKTAVFDLKVAIGDSGFVDAFAASLRGLTSVLRELPVIARAGALTVNDIFLAYAEGARMISKLPGPAGMMKIFGSDPAEIDRIIAHYRRLGVELRKELDNLHLPPDFNDPINPVGRSGAGAAADGAAGEAAKKKADAYAQAAAALRLENEALQLTLAGREREIPLLELTAKLKADDVTMSKDQRDAYQALVDQNISLTSAIEAKNEAEAEAKRLAEQRAAQIQREEQSIADLISRQGEQLTVLYQKLQGDEEQARWLETLNGLNLELTSLTDEQTQAIKANLAAIEEYNTALAEKQRIEQVAADVIERQITAEERRAAAIRDVEAALTRQLLTEQQAAAEIQRLELEGNKLYQLATGMKDEFAATFTDIIIGAESAGDAFINLAKQIEKAIVQALMLRAINAGIDSIFAGAGSAGSVATVDGNAGGAISYGMAKGGIIDRPTWVSPTQYAGEAGPEAVLPLTRTRGGNLGVMAMGGEQGPPVIVQVIDQRKGGGEIERQESTGPNGERQIQLFIRDEVRRQMDQGNFDGALRRNYGVTRTGSGR